MYAPDRPDLFRHFLESLPVAAAMVDREMRYLAVSRQWLEAFGLEEYSIIGRECEVEGFARDRESNEPERAIADTIGGEWLSHPWRDGRGEIAGTILSVIPRAALAADSLREREELFAATFEQGAIGICQCDLEGKILIANRKFCEIIGYSEEELPGLTYIDITHPEDLEIDSEHLRSLVAGDIPNYSLEKRYIHKQGFTVWIKLTTYPVREPSGKLKSLIAVVEDITQRKQAEAKLRQSEANLKAAQQMAHVGNWEFDVISQEITWSDEIFRIFGLEPSQPIPTYSEHRQMIHPDDVHIWENPIGTAISEGKAYEVEFRIVRPDGTVRYLFGQGQPTSEGGKVVRLFGTVLDITERKTAEIALQQANERLENKVEERTAQLRQTIEQLQGEITRREQVEAQLRQSQRRYKTLTQVSPVGIFHTDQKGNCLYANDRWLEMAGLTQEENLGDGWAKAIHPEDRERVFVEWYKAVRENRILNNEFRIVNPQGKVMWVLSQAAAEKDEAGEIIGYVGAVTNISDRKQAEETLFRISKAVDSSSDAIGITDANGSLIYVNTALCQLYECENLEDFNATGGIAAVYTDRNVLQEVFDTITSGNSWSGEVEQQTRSGRSIQVFLRADALKDRSGKIIGLIGIATDITERKALEKELARQQALLNTLIANSPVGIAILDSQLRYLQINETLAQINGVSVADHIGRSVREVLPELAPDVEPVFQEILRTGEPLLNVEISGSTPKSPGLERTWLASYIPLRSSEGIPIALGLIVVEISDRKRTEAELRYQAQLLDQLYDSVLTTDLNGIITKWNKGAERMYGYAASETIGESITMFSPPEERDRIFGEIMPSLLQQGSYEGEMKAKRKSGEIFDILLSITLQRDSNGEAIGTIGYGIDVTERKRLERERLATAQKLSLLIQQTPLALIEWSPDRKIMTWNPAAERIFGYSAAEALGRDFFELIVPDIARVNVSEVVEALKAQRGGSHGINENITKDGRTIVCEWYNNPVVDERGEFIAFASLAQDISDRVQAETALRRSEEKYRHLAQQEELLNQLTSLIRQSLDLDTILETTVQEIRTLLQLDRCQFVWYRPYSNPPMLEVVREAKNLLLPSLIGSYPATSAVSLFQKLYNQEMLRVDDVALLDTEARETMQQLGYTAILSLPIQTQGGDIGIVACIRSQESRPWRDSEVELLKALCDRVAIAINQAELYEQTRTAAAIAQAQSLELERALRELQQTQSQLIQSEKMSSLGQLVAGVAHEINNPVSFIYGNINHAQEYASSLLKIVQLYSQACPNPPASIQDEIDALELDFLIEDMPRVLSSMKIGAQRIQEIVRSLRNFSRLDEAQVKEVNIHEGIDSTLMILNSRLKAKPNRLAIEVVKEYGNLPLVECYPGQLNQVFMNLLSNAIDALEEGNGASSADTRKDSQSSIPTIRIRTSVENHQRIAISIADNGCGMSEAVRQKLFDPFFTTKPVGKGTGLGLAISYQVVVEKHQGSLRCVSAIGQGTEFIIEIPIRQKD